MVRATALVAALVLGGCAQHPERACGDPTAIRIVTAEIFAAADKAVQSSEWPPSTPTPPSKIGDVMVAMSRGGFLSIRNMALKAYDRTTRRATCEAEVHLVLSDLDKGPERRIAYEKAAVNGLEPPADLYGTDPFDRVEFTSQPTPDGKDTQVATASTGELTSAIIEIAMGRVLLPEKVVLADRAKQK